MGDLSPHFSRSEFRSRDGVNHPDTAVLLRLVAHLEALRCLVGKPMRIISGYRSPAHNRAVGGATNSRHMAGDAVDLPSGYCTPAQAEAAGFTGIGTKGPWATHVDLRPGRSRWTYPT